MNKIGKLENEAKLPEGSKSRACLGAETAADSRSGSPGPAGGSYLAFLFMITPCRGCQQHHLLITDEETEAREAHNWLDVVQAGTWGC